MKNSITTFIKVMLLSIVTFGIYGAYWIMTNLYKEPDIGDDDIEKDADYVRRAVASAFLARHDFH